MRRFQLVFILFCTIALSGCSVFSGKQAGIKVTANVPAAVSLDGKQIGTTPFQSSEQKPKKYTLKIAPADPTFTPYETSLKLLSGYLSQIDWSFGKTEDESSGFAFEYEDARDKNKAELQLIADPDNVPVIVDGKNVGFTPLLLDSLDEGDHSISLSAPGYDDAARNVRLVKGVRTLMTTKLAKKAAPEPTPIPIATESAQVTATASAKKSTPNPTPKATPKTTIKPSPTASASAKVAATPTPTPAASSSAGVKKTTTTKPYVEILSTETGFLRVRESPVSGKEVYKLAIGSTVPYANASSSGWLKITYDGTSTGWVSGDYSKLVQ